MGKIKHLSKNFISKIAAGEVIERPAYAVKELIENSLDANSTYIKIDIEESGLKKITVTDNGEGMDEEDLRICYLPHTTSKITEDSLSAIPTLGFRGEALASLTAAARIKITSRTKENRLGYEILISDGKLKTENPAGTPVGTRVVITNLFEFLPARKRFLKTKRTEYRHILDILTQYALAFPEINFEFTHNNKTIINLPTTQNIPDRIRVLLGENIYENIMPFSLEDPYLKINGYLCKPQYYTSTPHRQHIFVNKRRINDSTISTAVKESYSSLLDHYSLPVFIMFLTMPNEFIDINIHPRKEQIAFINSEQVYTLIQKAVKQTLFTNNLAFSNQNWKVNDMTGSTLSFGAKFLKDQVLSFSNTEIDKTEINTTDIMQVHNLYLIVPTKQGVAFFDQHAVHERILYEKLKTAFQKKRKDTFVLKQPLMFELNFSDTQIMLDNRELFKQLGFSIQDFGQNTFKLESAPLVFKDWDNLSVIKEILEDLRDNKSPKEIDNISNRMLQYLACRSAIKAGYRLTKQQAKEIIKDIPSHSYTCPHGRPLKLELPLSYLHRLFKRK